jgi:hypothetical protein
MSSLFGEPPLGIDLTENYTPRNNAVVITVYILAALAVGLRIIARTRAQNARIPADDWLIVAALV